MTIGERRTVKGHDFQDQIHPHHTPDLDENTLHSNGGNATANFVDDSHAGREFGIRGPRRGLLSYQG